MLVYRLEDVQTGQGPFSSPLCSIYAKAAGPDATNPWNHPGPDQESAHFMTKWNRLFPKWGRKNLRFGFVSPEQYYRWFDSAKGRKAIADLNGVIRVFQVHPNSVIQGDRQVVFHLGRAREVAVRRADFDLTKL